jgi:hypothetical protein
MNDLALIQAFVQSFVQGKAVLLSNPNLRVEPAFDTTQLLAKKEGLIATAKLTDKPRSVLVKQKSSHWELIHRVMLGESCFPIRQMDGFYTYQYRTVPEGYQMNCTSAMDLFQRFWWSRSSHNYHFGIPMDLLILAWEAWYPIRDLHLEPRNEMHHEMLYVKTLRGEVALHGSDIVVWLKKIKENSSDAATPSIGMRPGSRGYLRPRS